MKLSFTRDTRSVAEWPAEYLEFIDLFNRGEFYDAHEVLEDIWVIEVEPLKDFYKGLIQLTAAFWHWERGHKSSSLNLLNSARQNLRFYPDVYEGLPLAKIQQEARRVIESSFDSLEEDDLKLSGEENMPVLELTDGAPTTAA